MIFELESFRVERDGILSEKQCLYIDKRHVASKGSIVRGGSSNWNCYLLAWSTTSTTAA